MDSFINKLTETKTIKSSDFTVFDIADTTTGNFYTRKVAYDSIFNQLSADISAAIGTRINTIENNLNITNSNVNKKLDKTGLNLNNNEKMTGTLLVDAVLSAKNTSHFANTMDLHGNYISNVRDPNLDQDAVTKKYLNDRINGLNIPNTSSFLLKSGDELTGGDLKLFRDPTDDKHATPKKWVDTEISKIKTLVSNSTSNYLPLSGGTMTGPLVLQGFSEKLNNITGTGTLTLDLKQGNTFPVSVTGNITSITITNVPTDSVSISLFMTMGGTGSYSVTWNINGTVVKWANGAPAVLTSTVGKTDVVCLTKVGAIWYGFSGGQNFS